MPCSTDSSAGIAAPDQAHGVYPADQLARGDDREQGLSLRETNAVSQTMTKGDTNLLTYLRYNSDRDSTMLPETPLPSPDLTRTTADRIRATALATGFLPRHTHRIRHTQEA